MCVEAMYLLICRELEWVESSKGKVVRMDMESNGKNLHGKEMIVLSLGRESPQGGWTRLARAHIRLVPSSHISRKSPHQAHLA
jgi:hypothetical protein